MPWPRTEQRERKEPRPPTTVHCGHTSSLVVGQGALPYRGASVAEHFLSWARSRCCRFLQSCRSKVEVARGGVIVTRPLTLHLRPTPRCRPPVLPRLDSGSLSRATIGQLATTTPSAVVLGTEAANSSALAAASCGVSPHLQGGNSIRHLAQPTTPWN